MFSELSNMSHEPRNVLEAVIANDPKTPSTIFLRLFESKERMRRKLLDVDVQEKIKNSD